jgi:hypothetical protein
MRFLLALIRKERQYQQGDCQISYLLRSKKRECVVFSICERQSEKSLSNRTIIYSGQYFSKKKKATIE